MAGGRGGGGVSDFFKESKSEKKIIFFRGGEGKGGLASIGAFVLQRFQIKKKKFF